MIEFESVPFSNREGSVVSFQMKETKHWNEEGGSRGSVQKSRSSPAGGICIGCVGLSSVPGMM